VKNIKLIYCNGCSHSAAGGLEIDRTLTDDITYIRDYYKTRYGVWWDTQTEITYSHRLAGIIGCDVVNEATSGGGTERVIRMAYQFVQNNFKIKDSIFLILELPSLGRLDMFSKTLDDYIITNIKYSTDDYRDDTIIQWYACRDYSITGDLEKIGAKNVKIYLDNFHTRKSEYNKIARQINTFLTYLKYHNIKFIFTNGEFNASIHSDLKKNNLINIKLGNMIITDFHQFSVDTNSTIAEETDLLTMDLHPGYFAHLRFAELLDGYIKEKYDTF
jgi:hypothetical protein